MKKMEKNCIDCGCEAVSTTIDEVKPAYRMSMTHFSCGAVTISTTGAHGQVAKVSHEGCCSVHNNEAA